MAYTELDGFGIRTVFNQVKPVKQLYKKLIGLELDLVSSYSKFALGDISTGNITPRGDITEVWLEGQGASLLIDLSPSDFAALLPIGPGVDPAKVKASSADTTADYLENKLTAGSNIVLTKLNPGADEEIEISSTGGNTLYNANDAVGSGRIATVTDTLTWQGGSIRRSVNSTTIVEVTQESDFGTLVAGSITLSADTTYLIRGTVNIANDLIVDTEGISIIGTNRNLDKLVYQGTGDLLTITDANFALMEVWISSTTSGSCLINASNIDALGYNVGRLKVLEIFNCQFRNCYDVMNIVGFDLIDISQTLFFYIEAPNFGLRFEDTSKIQISSCELIRWFDETSIPTPSGYATCSMIELQANNLASFGAVNINGCIVHPQQTQNGIEINTGSTTGFGTISSNAFVTVGLTTGEIFLPVASGLPDYSQTATYNYDVFANQGILNSTSGCVMTVVGNTTDTALSTGVPAAMNTGGGASVQAAVRYTVTAAGRCTYDGTKPKYVSMHASLTYEKQGGGTDTYLFYFYKNGALLPGSGTEIIGSNTVTEGAFGMVYGTLMNQNDYIEVYIENTGSNDDMLVKDIQLVIRE